MNAPSMTRRAALLGAAALPRGAALASTDRLITGVNLAGLEFNNGKLPGRVDHDYVCPTEAELDYYRRCGARAVRLPFLWERLQPALGRNFDEAYWRLIDGVSRASAARGMMLILDAHQYGRRTIDGESRIIGEDDRAPPASFAAFWGEIARRCRDANHVIFGLQNEPHDQQATRLAITNGAAIAAIRAAGAQQLVLAPGSAWSGAHTWVSSGNAAAMQGVGDNNTAFDVHQYLDTDSSGTHSECVAGAARRLEAFTAWARAHRKRGFLGEFNAGTGIGCDAELTGLLDHVAANRDVWIGWACWAGGPWWPDDYPLTLEPASLQSPADRPQMTILRRYFE